MKNTETLLRQTITDIERALRFLKNDDTRETSGAKAATLILKSARLVAKEHLEDVYAGRSSS